MSDSTISARPGRIPIIDDARGVALVAMAIYHFTWDLEFFGWTIGNITRPGWVLFARCIASSFLFLVGVSLFLAHNEAIRWAGFGRRLAMVAGSAALISVATFFATPDSFIFFGILHAIALFSVLALPFVGMPWIVAAAAVAAILAIGFNLRFELFGHPSLWWVGLAPQPPSSNDYVPLFPWFAAVLAGLTAAKLAPARLWHRLAGIALPRPLHRPLNFFGRHSLVFYLVHQPVLISLLWLFTQIAGPPDPSPRFLAACQANCESTAGNRAQFCTAFCTCSMQRFKSEGLWTGINDRSIDITRDPRVASVVQFCSAQSR